MIIKKQKKIYIFFLTIFLGIGLFFLAPSAHASVSGFIGDVIGGLIGLIISALGLILILVMQVLVSVAQYSNFIHAPAVTNGWVIVRDICNMFFVLILLIIAFATILKLENYSYKKWLPKLILMAILINFSKTICGLLIDFAQVVMLTFVNAFKDIAAGNLVTSLGITDILTLAKEGGTSAPGFWEIIGAYVLGLLYILIALVVIVTMVAMLVMRIVMLWIYIVLSPAAYLMSAFPGGQKYASQWWSEFSKNLIVGPVLAFFIWLSFVSLQAQDMNADFPVASSNQSPTSTPVGATAASSPGVLIKFVIAIGMLIGGLKISQEIGGAAGGMAGKGMSQLSKGAAFAGGLGTGAALWAGRKGWAGTKAVGGGAAKLGGAALGVVDRKLGRLGDKIFKRKDGTQRTSFADKGLFTTAATGVYNAPGNFMTKIKARLNKNKDLNEKRRTFLDEERTKGEGNAVMEYNGKNFKKNVDKKDKKNYGKLYEVGSDGNAIAQKDAQGNDIAGSKNYLKTGEPGKEKEVKAMSNDKAVWHDAWRATGGQAKAASNKAQAEKISKEQEKIADSGQSNDELRRALMNVSTSADKKTAIAMVLAIKSGFKDKKEVTEAKKYLGSNTILQNKFNDEVDKNQTHLNYDLSVDEKGNHNNENDVAKFKNRIDIGKIDSTKLSPDAFKGKDNGTIKALRDFHGIDADRVIEANSKRSKRAGEAVSGALLQGRKYDDPKNPTKLAVDSKGNNADPNSKLHAKLTGKIEEAFTVNGKIDMAALGQYVKGAKSGDLSKINHEVIEASPNAPDLKRALNDNVNFAALKNLHRQGDNKNLVEMLVQEAGDKGHKDIDKIISDAELSTLLDPAVIKKYQAAQNPAGAGPNRKQRRQQQRQNNQNPPTPGGPTPGGPTPGGPTPTP